MSANFLKKIFKKDSKTTEPTKKVKSSNVIEMKKCYDNDDFVGSAIILKTLLEVYGIKKRKTHHYKGREFVYFILSNKHKDLKNLGYAHWQNINKIIQKKQKQSFPYHKKNMKNAIDFYTKEIKSINSLNVYI